MHRCRNSPHPSGKKTVRMLRKRVKAQVFAVINLLISFVMQNNKSQKVLLALRVRKLKNFFYIYFIAKHSICSASAIWWDLFFRVLLYFAWLLILNIFVCSLLHPVEGVVPHRYKVQNIDANQSAHSSGKKGFCTVSL